jgi:PAS domain-containing protein
VTISKVLDVRTIERARMAEALDALRCAVVLTNEHGIILHANRSA